MGTLWTKVGDYLALILGKSWARKEALAFTRWGGFLLKRFYD